MPADPMLASPMPTIRGCIDHRAEVEPDKVYLIAPEAKRELTYLDLREKSALLGRQLRRMGFRKGDTVSFMLDNGYQTAIIFLGAMYSGLVVSPLNLIAHPSQLSYVIDHSDTRLVFFAEKYREKLEQAVRSIDRPIERIQVDIDSGSVFLERQNLTGYELPDIELDDTAMILYTSGSTGLPKGVLLSHKNVVTGGAYTAMAHKLSASDRALCSLPLYHINGQVVTTVAPLVSGGSVVMPHRFSVSNFWELISTYRCTWFSVVPTIISYLVNATSLDDGNYRTEQVRFGRSASSALPPSLHKAFEAKFKVSIVETMGLTETTAPVFSNPLDPAKRKYGSPGRAVGNEAKIVDLKGNDVPCGTEGEILIRGDNVMKGYLKAPDKTAEALTPDGWLHTGDLGYMDGDGFVFVTGRIKELIIKGGENIAPREIDDVLYTHPAILEAAAVGIPDDQYGEEIMCCCVLKPDCVCTEEEIREHCREHLGDFKTPKMVRLVDDIPKGPSGKIQRLKLREHVE
jgi:acyl-CoA synthetase (AMP-forming)/AMP-acid ligase II